MAKRKGGLRKDASGQFYRQIGWKRGTKGQPKFRLGADHDKALLAHAKLGLLWRAEQERHQRQQAGFGADFEQPGPDQPAVWSDEGLAIAEAVRKHLHTLRVGKPDHIEDAGAYASYLDWLRHLYGHVIQIVPADVEEAEQGKQQHRQFAEHRSRQARLNARIANIPIPTGLIGQTLYQALDSYAARAEQASQKEGAKVEAATVRRLKDSTLDMDLSEFGYSAMERMRDYWAGRPEARTKRGRPSGKPISLRTVDNHLTTARRFVRWLDRSDDFEWELPRHGLDALTININRLRTPEETAALRHGVSTFRVEELATAYAVASDFQRLLILLGLNAAMAQAEIISLRWDEIEANPPTIKRIRGKSGVYGEFWLWPETVTALKWWKRITGSQSDLVMVTAAGRPYTRQRISNAWTHLRQQIEKSAGQPCDWWLSFKFLRKSSAQLVRDVADGEVAAVLLSHGQPVASDELSDRYTNRPFGKVAAALQQVREKLVPMFDAAPDAFTAKCVGRGPHQRAAV